MANDSLLSGGGGGGDTSPTGLLERARGRNLQSIWKQGLGAWLLTVSVSGILGIKAIVELFLLTPVDITLDLMETSAEAVIEKPLGVIGSGADQTAAALSETYIFGLPLSVMVVLGTFTLVGLYLRQPYTADLFAGTFTDVTGGTDEEDEE